MSLAQTKIEKYTEKLTEQEMRILQYGENPLDMCMFRVNLHQTPILTLLLKLLAESLRSVIFLIILAVVLVVPSRSML